MSIQVNSKNEIILYPSKVIIVSGGILSFLGGFIGTTSMFVYINETKNFIIATLVTLLSFLFFILCINKYLKPKALITINDLGINSTQTGKLLWNEIQGFKIPSVFVNDIDVLEVILKNGTILKLIFFSLPIDAFQLLEILRTYHKNPSDISSVLKTGEKRSRIELITIIIILLLSPLCIYILAKLNLL